MTTLKTFALAVSLTLPLSVFSAPQATPQANAYELNGRHIHISYTTTGIDGKPHFSYKNGNHTQSFRGDQIRTLATEIGTLVSVTTVMTVDTGSTAFSVLIPRVNLDQNRRAFIKTQGILTKRKFSVIPNFNKGQLDNYTFFPLTGTAKFLVF